MNIQGLHIGVDQALQNISSNRNRNILPEEIDFALNKVAPRYVSSKIKRGVPVSFGFQNIVADTAAISTLIESPHQVPLHLYSSGAGNLTNLRIVEIRLPENCLAPTSLFVQSALVACKTSEGPNFKKIPYYYYTIPLASTQISDYKYKKIEFSIGGVEFTINSEGTSDPTYNKYCYMAIKDRLERLDNQHKDFKLNWEYNDVLKSVTRNSIIIGSYRKFENLEFPKLIVDGTNIPIRESESSIEVVNTDLQFEKVVNPNVVIINEEFLATAMSSSFLKTSLTSVLAVHTNNSILLYYDESFIITVGVLGYVKKPREVSLSLGIDSDLPDRVDSRETIIDMAVQELRSNIFNTAN